MTNKGWVSTAKVFTIVPMLLGGFYLCFILLTFSAALDFAKSVQNYNYFAFALRFLSVSFIGILLVAGPFLFMLEKKSGWIVSVSSILAVIYMAVNSFIRIKDKNPEWIFIAILIGILIGLYFVCLFTTDVRNTFRIKKRELLITGIITLTCITVNYIY